MITGVHPLWWFALGATASLFCFGRWQHWLAPWVMPIFLLLFVHAVSPGAAVLGIVVVLSLSFAITSWRLVPVPGWLHPWVAMTMGIIQSIPFLLDRWWAPALPPAVGVFVFPLAWVAMELASGMRNPFGSWGAIAYTQIVHRSLMQTIAVTGLAGVAFLMAWLASVVRTVLQSSWPTPDLRWLLGPLVVTVVLVLATGRWRLRRANNQRSIRVAAIAWPDGILSMSALMPLFADPAARTDSARWQPAFDAILEHFIGRTRDAVGAGAQLVGWPEINVMVWSDTEAEIRSRIRDLARTTRAYLCVGMVVLERGPALGFRNIALLFDPKGKLLVDYTKITAVPGFENRHGVRGTSPIPIVDTPIGRLAVAICYDTDFPALIRQVGLGRADLLIVPTSDWPEIRKPHLAAVTCRAIENGVSLLRPTRWGISAVIDPTGRRIASLDHVEKTSVILIAEAPLNRRATGYPRFGQVFGWVCAVALAALGVAALVMP